MLNTLSRTLAVSALTLDGVMATHCHTVHVNASEMVPPGFCLSCAAGAACQAGEHNTPEGRDHVLSQHLTSTSRPSSALEMRTVTMAMWLPTGLAITLNPNLYSSDMAHGV